MTHTPVVPPVADDADPAVATDDQAIHALLRRLARPHRSGGHVVERAAIMAEGHDAAAIITWIEAHDGVPEAPTASGAGRGLHGSRIDAPGQAEERRPRRFILPAGALH
jgi:hypothetical protein